jgi:hypothetical protein
MVTCRRTATPKALDVVKCAATGYAGSRAARRRISGPATTRSYPRPMPEPVAWLVITMTFLVSVDLIYAWWTDQ